MKKRILILVLGVITVSYSYTAAGQSGPHFFEPRRLWKSLLPRVILPPPPDAPAHRAGDYDSTFNGDGKRDVTFSSGSSFATAVALESLTKIVVAGYISGDSPDETRLGLIRLNYDGSLDTSFGEDGKVEIEIPHTCGLVLPKAVDVKRSGKIIVAGSFSSRPLDAGARCRNSSLGSYEIFMAQFNSDGSLDTSFGDSGLITTDEFGLYRELGLSYVMIRANGKVIVAGSLDESYGVGESQFFMRRFNSDGTIDMGFGDGGDVVTSFGSGDARIRFLGLQSDGKIIAAGSYDTRPGWSTGTVLALARYHSDGTLDLSFGGGDGKVTTDTEEASEHASGLVILDDDKILTQAWGPATGIPHSLLVRYESDGALDSAFGESGILTLPSYGITEGMVLQEDGKIVLSPNTRLHADGTRDDSFSSSSVYFYVNAMVIQPGTRSYDKLVFVGGDRFGSSSSSFKIGRTWLHSSTP